MEYRLYRGDCLLGVLTSTDRDCTWYNGTFEARSEFEELRSLFEREQALLNEDRIEEWGEVWDGIMALGLRLEDAATQADIHEFLLHIDGSQASWRY
ncbi:hypothetical protein NG895_23710 [Aeoliella sp. ICT_H6.2]|uniref:Uncharacterized protein n=1 Tax=Aeoliella straminimaris TaxID=2954799 RepID=A0A9X2JJM6_9BACT|nr:hypothetical protein [Aeoliella straminimaris]MCO6046918.1 hypothetical protein [Aeoliella straminimaris]